MEGHGERTEHGTDPKEESEKRRQGAPSGKSDEGPEERNERKAQDERNGKHHSTWRRKRETRNGKDTEEMMQSSGPKDKKQSAHDDDTRHGIQTTSPGNSPEWKLFGSGQADEPLPKRIRRCGRIARDTKCSQTKHVEVLVKAMEVGLSE